MLTAEQMEHFDVFGFLCLRQVFCREEMAQFTRAADEVIAAARGGGPDDGASQGLALFVELHPRLLDLAEDERILGVTEDLLGSGYLWSGSRGISKE